MTTTHDDELERILGWYGSRCAMQNGKGSKTPGEDWNKALAALKARELAAQTINRFEVINHLSDGSGREVIVWKGEPFTAEFSLQDDGRTLKVFLTDLKSQQQENEGK